ncbi:hypothetical protein C5748_17050 [Phyllobacterium phragmitis]|uniref:Uncharacterized protein n=1 Tax=Phyllobacterium phragmitis TaxID=2670329 RepID=A0A2S9INS4_9HYPH|nr:hypothetical protein [Phyllobacterium phragmitis]PRD42173.1 hypothetical protein C5748_17050 [Phyllobacterium phragmitis]
MADQKYAVANGVFKLLKDMGDGTHAEVVATETAGGGGAGASNITEVGGNTVTDSLPISGKDGSTIASDANPIPVEIAGGAPFAPNASGTVNIAATNASANVALSSVQDGQVMVTNGAGGDLSFIEFGDGTVAATVTTGTPVNPGTSVVFSVTAAHTHMAAISAGTSTVYATTGKGT